MSRSLPLLVFLALALALGMALLLPTAERTKHAPSGLVGKPLPELALVPLDSKKEWDEHAWKGKITVVNLFASWCAPCVAELPEFVAMKEAFPQVHLLGIGWHDTPENIRNWTAEYDAPYDAVWRDANNRTGVALGIRGIPETLILDAEGFVRYHVAGPIDAGSRDGFIAALKELAHEAR